jgi:hypothetical protein
MTGNEVKITINADGAPAVAGLRNVESETARSVSTMEQHWTRLGAAIAGAFSAYKMAEYVRDSAMLAARVETLGVVMEVTGRNAGYNAEQVREYSEQVKAMGITTQASRQTIIDMAQSQIDLSQASTLARIAQDAAVIGNINSSEALNRMLYGIKSAQVEVLRTIGMNVNFEDSYKRLARQLGKNTETLTEKEKAQARVNAVLNAGARIAGSYEAAMGTAGKQITTISRYSEEAQLKIGQIFTPALSVAVTAATMALKGLNDEMDEVEKSGEKASWAYGLAEAMKAIAVYTVGVAAAFDIAGTAAGEFFGRVEERAKRLVRSPWTIFTDEHYAGVAGYEETEKRLARYAEIMDRIWKIGSESAAKKAAGAGGAGSGAGDQAIQDAKKASDLNKKIQEEIAKLTMTEQQHIDYQVKAWRKEGADRVLLEKWKTGQLQKLEDDYAEKSMKRIQDAYKAEQDLAEKIVMISLKSRNAALEADTQQMNKVIEWSLRAGTITDSEAIRKRNESQTALLAGKREEIDLALQQIGYDENLMWVSSEMIQLLRDKEALDKDITLIKEYEVYELAEAEISRAEKLRDIRSQILEMAEKERQLAIDNFVSQLNLPGGDISKGMGGMFGSITDLLAANRGDDRYSQMITAFDEQVKAEISYLTERDEIDAAWKDADLMREEMYQQQKFAIYSNYAKLTVGVANTVRGVLGQNNTALFVMEKAAMIAMTLVAAHAAAAAAVAPPPLGLGPVAGPPLAATMLAFGYAQAAIIGALAIAQGVSGGGTAASTPSAGGYSYSQPTTPSWESETKTEERPMTINVHVYGSIMTQDEIARELVPAIKKAIGDGAH